MSIILIVSYIITLAYACLILLYAYFFNHHKKVKSETVIGAKTKVSIIVAARNEAHCITNLLHSVNQQSYPKDLFEIIVVDDASTDDTYKVVKTFSEKHTELNLKLLKLEDDLSRTTYKKYAISKAMHLISNDLIVSTDADCVAGTDWIKEIVALYEQTKSKMIVGLVAYQNDNTVFQKMQHLEFLSLVASGAAAVNSGYPVMCNGANLIYEKKAFDEVNGFDANDNFASGDDVFLLLKMKKFFGKESISVLSSKSAIVYTEAKKTLAELTHQRLRWASKTKGYRDVGILFVAALVFGFNLIIVANLMLGFFYPMLFTTAIKLFILKIAIDFPILLIICNYLKRIDLLLYYLPLQLLYLPYVLLIGSIGNFVSYYWKGRKVKS